MITIRSFCFLPACIFIAHALFADALLEDERNTIEIFERVSPSVVFITSKAVQWDFFSINVFEIPQGSGSGFVWDKTGHIVTNFHVIQGADKLSATLSTGNSFDATVVGADPSKDLAVIKIKAPAKELIPVSTGDMKNVKDAIRTAIQMEQEGYDFYQKAAAQTSSEMGESVFKSLAADELLHLEVFQKIFDEKIGKDEWHNLVNSGKKYADIQVFPKDLKRIEGANPDTSEIDAIRIAMDSEKRAIEYYNEIKQKSSDKELIEIIEEIINQEKSHYQILEGEFHHINSTGYWFDLDYLGGQNF